ncbi:Uracil permease [Klebsiella michiganensis]|uniref:Uracil permease n=1 Tax=Klebsiella michiganensis TaxID=1134687 RepID=A0A7H4N1S7_9ENTR|nr:Uracil permease [Klebsiella michiganensis]
MAENLGHLKAVAGMTGRNMDPYMGRAFVGDGLATMLSGSVGGSGVTTYAENIGVMAVTKVYSTLVFVAAALIAMLLGFFTEIWRADPYHSGTGDRRRIDCGVRPDCRRGRANLGAEPRGFEPERKSDYGGGDAGAGGGDFALSLGGFTLGGIGTATFGAIPAPRSA